MLSSKFLRCGSFITKPIFTLSLYHPPLTNNNAHFATFKRFKSTSETTPPTIETPPGPPEMIIDSSHCSGNIMCIGFNRAKAKNALSMVLLEQMKQCIENLAKDDCSVRTVLFHSMVPGVFSAGADLKERLNIAEADVGPFVSGVRELLDDIARLPMPTICALDGYAFGGGFELALACDLRVAASNVQLGLVEARLGILPGAGGTQRLPRLVGASKAKELIFLGRRISAVEAEKIGAVNTVVEQTATGDAAFQFSLNMARELVTESAPLSLKWAKVAIDHGMEKSQMVEALDIEDVCYSQIIQTTDRIEGLKAFMEKRKPIYEGK